MFRILVPLHSKWLAGEAAVKVCVHYLSTHLVLVDMQVTTRNICGTSIKSIRLVIPQETIKVAISHPILLIIGDQPSIFPAEMHGICRLDYIYENTC